MLFYNKQTKNSIYLEFLFKPGLALPYGIIGYYNQSENLICNDLQFLEEPNRAKNEDKIWSHCQ